MHPFIRRTCVQKKQIVSVLNQEEGWAYLRNRKEERVVGNLHTHE